MSQSFLRMYFMNFWGVEQNIPVTASTKNFDLSAVSIWIMVDVWSVTHVIPTNERFWIMCFDNPKQSLKVPIITFRSQSFQKNSKMVIIWTLSCDVQHTSRAPNLLQKVYYPTYSCSRSKQKWLVVVVKKWTSSICKNFKLRLFDLEAQFVFHDVQGLVV